MAENSKETPAKAPRTAGDKVADIAYQFAPLNRVRSGGWDDRKQLRPLTHNRDPQTGLYTITYNDNQLGGMMKKSLQQALQEIANAGNIKFVRAQAGTRADITCIEDDRKIPPRDLGITDYYTHPDGRQTRTITLSAERLYNGAFNKGGLGYGVMLHELGHALGLSHPGNKGLNSDANAHANKDYTSDQTLMSSNETYKNGEHREIFNFRLRPLDIRAIGELYGESRGIGVTPPKAVPPAAKPAGKSDSRLPRQEGGDYATIGEEHIAQARQAVFAMGGQVPADMDTSASTSIPFLKSAKKASVI